MAAHRQKWAACGQVDLEFAAIGLPDSTLQIGEVPQMTQYLIRRLLIAIPVFIGITMLVYGGVALAPGDPLQNMVSFEQLMEATPAEIALMRRSLGLDQPLPVRYAKWLREMLKGNLGYSLKKKAPVVDLIEQRFVNTLQLAGAALFLSLVTGIASGVIMALKQYSWMDYALSLVALGQWSMPAFFVALAAMWLFAIKLHWLPAFGMYTVGQDPSLWDSLRHLIMPATILSLPRSASFARYTRASMLEALHSEYVTTARAKGLQERAIVLRHVARNAALPVITMIGLSIPQLLSGAVITETIFAWPGMGKLSVSATLSRDVPLLMGTVILAAILVLLSNLATDLAYAVADPRIRYD